MLNSATRLIGMRLLINDEPFGLVKDVLFNDADMSLSVLVVATTNQRQPTEVLLPIRDIADIDIRRKRLLIRSERNLLWVRLNGRSRSADRTVS